jgi:hypothetical protein
VRADDDRDDTSSDSKNSDGNYSSRGSLTHRGHDDVFLMDISIASSEVRVVQYLCIDDSPCDLTLLIALPS